MWKWSARRVLLSAPQFSRRVATMGAGAGPSPPSSASPTAGRGKVLSADQLNPHVRRADYAVRGELAIRAEELRAQLRAPGKRTLPFDRVINCNIGNPQQLGQAPIAYFRQVLSLVENAGALLSDANEDVSSHVRALYPADVIARAQKLLQAVEFPGAYSHSKGAPGIRDTVAQFLARRDGHEADPESIFLTSGASDGVKMLLQLLIDGPDAGVLVPVPQYPLYTATIALYDGKAVPYYLDEERGWALSTDEVLRALYEARAAGTRVKAIVVINPGNPTGNVLSEQDVRELVDLCHRERLLILADEVYQENAYYPETRPFVSFKRVLRDMGPRYRDVELVSFHSISKGVVGECGTRGGFFEAVNIDAAAVDELYKLASISLCPNVLGQMCVDLMVDPPRPGDPSYERYAEQTRGTFDSLRRRAEALCEAFNSLKGVSCQPANGAMYLFPRIELPAKAVARAAELGKVPDTFYCLELLNATGVCVVPGSGFCQKPGTFHFRSTILPPEAEIEAFVARFRSFHNDFMARYS